MSPTAITNGACLDRQRWSPGSAIGHAGNYAGQFSNIHVIASDSKGNIYVGDGGGRFQELSTRACRNERDAPLAGKRLV